MVYNNYRSTHNAACSNKFKGAVFHSEYIKFDDDLPCKLEPIGASFWRSWCGPAVPNDFVYKESLNYGILKLHETGLISYLKLRWTRMRVPATKTRPYEPITWGKIVLPVIVYSSGLFTSITIVVIECLLHSSNSRSFWIRMNFVKFALFIHFGRSLGNEVHMRDRSNISAVLTMKDFLAANKVSKVPKSYHGYKRSCGMNDKQFHLFGRELRNVLEFYNDNQQVTGLVGDFWNILSEYMDYTNRLFIKPDYRFETFWMLDIYSWKIWILVLLFSILLSTSSLFSDILMTKYHSLRASYSILNHYFCCFGALCNQRDDFCIIHKNNKIFTFSINIFSWLLIACFSSQIFVVMTRAILIPPFNSLEDLFFDTDYVILLKNYSKAHKAFQARLEPIMDPIINSNRVRYYENFGILQHAACANKFRSAAVHDEILKMEKNLTCVLEPVGKRYWKSWISSGVPKNFSCKDLLNYR
ncbi:hypothetical protein QAD02_010906 [Eretmocerus hayati]|uniref:Uncharacterized protein n=1 Tax=Eretmocerus hayati TaxID=131215 RepID=A0ACC2P010_9HYME|nr:hypothetical protein QAD02_010906 [Eretmocerus hayati]